MLKKFAVLTFAILSISGAKVQAQAQGGYLVTAIVRDTNLVNGATIYHNVNVPCQRPYNCTPGTTMYFSLADAQGATKSVAQNGVWRTAWVFYNMTAIVRVKIDELSGTF